MASTCIILFLYSKYIVYGVVVYCWYKGQSVQPNNVIFILNVQIFIIIVILG